MAEFNATPNSIEEQPIDANAESLTPTETDNTTGSQSSGILGKRKPRKRSKAWDHFERTADGKRAVCLYCKVDFACDTQTCGTSTLNKHMKRCSKFPGRKEELKQKCLAFAPISNEAPGNLLAVNFNKERCRRACAEYIIVAELPFKHIENPGFKKFCFEIQPKLALVSRTTIARDVFQLYLDEKKKLKTNLEKYRVSLTTDTWWSIQNIDYMCVTAHFIDANWTLHKRIIGFFMVPNHRGDTVGRELETCLREWGITKVMAITVDNASSNTTAMTYLRRKLQETHGLVLLDGKQLHLRCCAHIINLIVTDGLKEIGPSIDSIRNAVRYVRSSTARAKKFKECVDEERIESKALLALDVCTRWNSMYLMLDTALKFRKAFDRMIGDGNYDIYFQETEQGKVRDGPPTDFDWENAKEYVACLRKFYKTTLKFSG